MQILQYLHRDRSVYVTYGALYSYIWLLICRLLDATLADPTRLSGWLIPLEAAIFVLPLAVWLWLNRGRLTASQLHLSRPSPRHIPLMLVSSVALVMGGLLLTILLSGSGIRADSFSLYHTFRARMGDGFFSTVYLILGYAVLPAICEELFYRSLLCGELGRHGPLSAVLVSSLLFGMLHFELQLLPLYVAAGAALSLVMYATRSVFAAMIVHTAYNLFCIFAQPYVISFYINTASRPLFLMLSVTMFLLSAALTCLCCSRLYRQYAAEGLEPAYNVSLNKNQKLTSLGILTISLPFILCAITYLIAVIVF